MFETVWHPHPQQIPNRHQRKRLRRLRLDLWILKETAFENGGGASVCFRLLFCFCHFCFKPRVERFAGIYKKSSFRYVSHFCFKPRVERFAE